MPDCSKENPAQEPGGTGHDFKNHVIEMQTCMIGLGKTEVQNLFLSLTTNCSQASCPIHRISRLSRVALATISYTFPDETVGQLIDWQRLNPCCPGRYHSSAFCRLPGLSHASHSSRPNTQRHGHPALAR
jgi:hypothetical protein